MIIEYKVFSSSFFFFFQQESIRKMEIQTNFLAMNFAFTKFTILVAHWNCHTVKHFSCYHPIIPQTPKELTKKNFKQCSFKNK